MPASTASGWNFADVWESHADCLPDAPALTQGDRRTTWAQFDRRADGIASTLLAAGAGHQDKVAQYLYNCPEYLETVFGCWKAALVPVNTNYRYGDDELVYLWDNADAVAVVFHAALAERADRVRPRVPRVRTWIWVADESASPCPDWAVPFEEAAASAPERVQPAWGRSGDDVYMLYTGGTTGVPKGVQWRQDDVFVLLDRASRHPLPEEPDMAALAARFAKPGPRSIPAAPLMHGTGAFNSFNILQMAGSITTLLGRHFDAVELLDAVQRERINSLSIVGDAFAKPVLGALDAEPDRWDVSSLRVIISSGVMWSAETKAGLLRHNPKLMMIDSLGSSEAIGMGSSTTTADDADATARFRLNASTKVLTEDGREVVPGSGELGRVALRGRAPLGYYKDEAKTAATFQVLDGVRWSIPGDWAEVDADGSVRLLGRGSQCINSGGEKIYPEEVEEALKTHAGVADAVVVGVPDERFGEAVTAMVELAPGRDVDPDELVAHVKGRLAGFKAPKRVLVIDSVARQANGKVDYRHWKRVALDRTASG